MVRVVAWGTEDSCRPQILVQLTAFPVWLYRGRLIRGYCARSLWFILSGHWEICSDAESTHATAVAYILVFKQAWHSVCEGQCPHSAQTCIQPCLSSDIQPSACPRLKHVCYTTHLTYQK